MRKDYGIRQGFHRHLKIYKIWIFFMDSKKGKVLHYKKWAENHKRERSDKNKIIKRLLMPLRAPPYPGDKFPGLENY